MSYNVTIEPVAPKAAFDLKGDQKTVAAWFEAEDVGFPEAHNTFTRSGSQELLWIGENHWFLRDAMEREEIYLARRATDDISVVHISDTLAAFHISGPDAGEIMAIASPLDLHPSKFPQNGASYTEVFGLKALVTRREAGFELAVERSFSDMLEDYLSRATGTQA